jgi:pilus assembly protein Flp/PilA
MIVKMKCETVSMSKSVRSFAQRFARDDSGTTAIEYCLIASLIAVACITAFRQLGTTNTGVWAEISNKITAAMK